MSENQFCYAITVGDKTKIGLSKDPESRVRGILTQSGTQFDDAVISAIRVKNMRACEKACHQYLSDVRTVGEWFSVSHEAAVEAINMNIDAGGEIHPAAKPSILSMETLTRGLYPAKHKMDVAKAIYELSRYGDVSEDIATAIVAASHCDSAIVERYITDNKKSNVEVAVLNAIYEHLLAASYDLCATGAGVIDRMSSLCRIDTGSAAINALEAWKEHNPDWPRG